MTQIRVSGHKRMLINGTQFRRRKLTRIPLQVVVRCFNYFRSYWNADRTDWISQPRPNMKWKIHWILYFSTFYCLYLERYVALLWQGARIQEILLDDESQPFKNSLKYTHKNDYKCEFLVIPGSAWWRQQWEISAKQPARAMISRWIQNWNVNFQTLEFVRVDNQNIKEVERKRSNYLTP